MPKYDIYGGRALTAADVKYSYDRVLGLDGVEKVVMDQTDWAGSLYMIDSVEAPTIRPSSSTSTPTTRFRSTTS